MSNGEGRSIAASNRSDQSKSKGDTRGQTAKDYAVAADPDIRGAVRGRPVRGDSRNEGRG